VPVVEAERPLIERTLKTGSKTGKIDAEKTGDEPLVIVGE
jgi:hypothetical protein